MGREGFFLFVYEGSVDLGRQKSGVARRELVRLVSSLQLGGRVLCVRPSSAYSPSKPLANSLEVFGWEDSAQSRV